MRPPAWFALSLGLALMMWDLADAQRDPEPDTEIMVCEFDCPVIYACGDEPDWESLPPPPPPRPYVARDFRIDPIDDEEIGNAAEGRP